MNTLCEGCSSITGRNIDCTLKPKYKNKQCPCVTCIVKMVCTENYNTCEKYGEFCEFQLEDIDSEELPPCEECKTYKECLCITHKIVENYTEIFPNKFKSKNIRTKNVLNSLISESLYIDSLGKLQEFCTPLRKYFPFVILGDDNEMVQPEYKNTMMKEDIWYYRESKLFDLFDCLEIVYKLTNNKKE